MQKVHTTKPDQRSYPAYSMASSEQLIMVIDSAIDRARNLKGLIEFMDARAVRIADPGNWQTRIGESRLAAIFLRKDLAKKELDRIIGAVGELDPNVPIVLISEEPND